MNQNFNNNSFHAPSYQTAQSISSSDMFNINNLSLPHYGSSPNLAPQVQQFNYPQQQNFVSNNLDINDPNLIQQVDQIVASLSEYKRPMLRRQVVTVPAQCPGRVAQITRRLPTPAPDIIERITVIKPPRDIVNLCIEKPVQPEPCFQAREICGKPKKPLIQPRVVSVAPRSNPCFQSQQSPCNQQQQQYQPQQQPIYQQQYHQPQYGLQYPQQYGQQYGQHYGY